MTMRSSRDRVEEALARMVDPALEGARSCLTTYAESARRAADEADARARAGRSLGPLDGRVITIKDLFDVAGEVTRAGSPALARRARPAVVDAPAVSRLRAAGAVIVAKTNMTEFAFSGVGANPHFGTPGNPADRKRIPGGSSSGGAVACADGIGEIAIGTDTGGSTRIPAALCGLVGFKPTARRVSLQGVHPLSRSLDSVGPLAPSVEGCFIADAALSDSPPSPLVAAGLTSVRIGIVQGTPLEDVDVVVGAQFERALRRLAPARVVDVKIAALQRIGASNARGGLAAPEAYADHRELLAEAGGEIDPFIRARMESASGMPAADYIACLRDRAEGISEMDAVFEHHDVLALPTTPIVAPTHEEVASAEGFASRNRLLLRNTSIANFFDLCALSLPLTQAGTLPCGLMLLARTGRDQTLFQIAAALEPKLHGDISA
jgi:aspartyl-tRNA(Asn)/glutamyl-tRNA(Gln) amidotransferase subunit A